MMGNVESFPAGAMPTLAKFFAIGVRAEEKSA